MCGRLQNKNAGGGSLHRPGAGRGEANPESAGGKGTLGNSFHLRKRKKMYRGVLSRSIKGITGHGGM